MAGQSTVTVAERQTTIQVQQSSYGQPIPVVYGTNRIAGNLVWFGNFQANSQTTTSGGKGLGGSSTNTTYTYTAAAILAVAEGPIPGISNVWKDTEQSSLSDLNLTLFTGAATQAPWSFLTGYSNATNWASDSAYGMSDYSSTPTFVSQAINYSSTAYLASSSYDLGNAASIPNHNFEVQGFQIVGSGNVDANAATVIPDILTSQQYGIGFNAAWVSSLSSGAASYGTYCQAAGLFISPAYTQQRPGADVIQELTDATNAAVVWSGGALKIIPYGDTTITGNGVTYTPVLTPSFDLADDDFIRSGSDEPILVTRSSPADAYNRIAVQFKNRANQYNQEVVYAEDQDAIEKYGLKIASTITMDFVCVSSIAKQMAQLALQRLLYKRNTYEFEIGARYAMLEPMDIVTLTDPGLGMSRLPVRITKIEEQDHSFKITAEDLPIGVAQAATYHHDDGVRWTSATDIPPASCAAPVIFELPADPSATGLSVAIAAGGQPTDLAYGGCNVWLSLDGTNYKHEGTIWGSSRYGTLSGPLAAHAAGMDTGNTLGLSLRSNGQMISGSATDVAKGTTLIVCDGEYLAYQTATLTGTRAYNLTTLNRGLYSTTPAAHASGAVWARIDDAIATLTDLNLNMIGQTVYIKLTAFNVYGRAEQALSSVSAYSYTITGNMKALETPVDFANVGGTTKPANNATVGATTGTNLSSGTLGVLSDGQIVTNLGTASSITGQSSWATYNALTPTQLTTASPNLVYNPSGRLGLQGWTQSGGAGLGSQYGSYGEGYFWQNGSASSAAGGLQYYQDIACLAGTALSISAKISANGLSFSSGTVAQARVYVEWINSSKAHIAYTGVCVANAGNGWGYPQVPNQLAPAGTAYARVWIDIWGNGTWTNTNSAWRQIKVEQGSVCTPFSDETTYGALYQSGQTIDTLKPAQANADVTSTNTAAAITGQGSLATQSTVNLSSQVINQLPVANAAAGLVNANVAAAGANRVRFSLGEKGTYGWSQFASGATVTAFGTSPANMVLGFYMNGTATASAQYVGFASASFAVTPGEQLAVMARFTTNGVCTGAMNINWINSSGAFLSQTASIGGTTATGTTVTLQGMVTVPAGAYSAVLIFQCNTTGAGSCGNYVQYPAVIGVPTGQTAFPSFAPGPNSADGADVTATNTAAAISGQGPLATSGLTPSQVMNANVTLGANGALNGAGGGQVTIGGLGYQGSMLATQGPNVIWQSKFGSGNGGAWGFTSVGGWITVGPAGGPDGSGEIQCSARDTFEQGNLFPVMPGQKYFVEAWCWTANGGSNAAAIGLHFTNASGGGDQWVAGATLAAGNGWTRISGSLTVPSGAAYAQPWLQNAGWGTGLPYIAWAKLFIGQMQPGADITGANVAAAVAGQGALATLNTVNTSNIISGAVSGYTATAVSTWTLTSVSISGWRDVGSITFTPSSSSSLILILVSFEALCYDLNAPGNKPVSWQLTGTSLGGTAPTGNGNSSSGTYTNGSASTLITGISSPTTLTLQVAVQDVGDGYGMNCSIWGKAATIVALELKR